LLFLFLKGMAGALAPFSYLVSKYFFLPHVRCVANDIVGLSRSADS
jgi:hypothetical protein